MNRAREVQAKRDQHRKETGRSQPVKEEEESDMQTETSHDPWNRC